MVNVMPLIESELCWLTVLVLFFAIALIVAATIGASD